MSNTVSNFIKKLDTLNDNKIEVFLPSTNKEVKAQPLNLKQQKDLLSLVAGGINSMLEFETIINKIVLDNSGISDLKIYDKLPFIINLRIEALGNIATVDENKVDLHHVLTNLTDTPFELKDQKTIRYENLEINLKIPTLAEENAILTNCKQDNKIEDNDWDAGIKLLYLLDITKYIASLQIDDENVKMSEIRINERMDLIEKLPLTVYKEIAEYMREVKKYQDDILTVGDSTVAIVPTFFDYVDKA